jgi:GNAT superfamily N-acetyltransferase
MAYELVENGFLFSDRRELLEMTTIHSFLATSYWSPGIPREIVERAVRNSMPFGVYELGTGSVTPRQVGFARIISDQATYAYLADVFVLEERRGRGLSKSLVRFIIAHPELQGLRRIALMTKDAQELYRKFGFEHLDDPTRFMQRFTPPTYGGAAGS